MAIYDIALDERLDLLHWWQSPNGQWAIRYLTQNDEDTHLITARRYKEVLSESDSIYVDNNTCVLIEAAAQSFKAQPLIPEDLYAKKGFVYLHKPLDVLEGVTQHLRAFHWQEIEVDSDEPMHIGGSSLKGVMIDIYCDLTGRTPEDSGPNRWHRLMPIHIDFIPYDFAYEDKRASWEPDLLTVRFFQTFLAMAKQRITVQTETEPSRPTRKRAARAQIGPSKLVVMHLPRRTYNHNGEDSGEAHYSHSFLVNGHWRNQWYPSRKMHRQKWIHPYVKGEGEFIAKDRVGTLTSSE